MSFQRTRLKVSIRGVMPFNSRLLFVAVMATLTSWRLCAADTGVEASGIPGTYHFISSVSGLAVEPVAQTRSGSLTLRHDHEDDANTTKVLSKLKLMAPMVQCGENLMTLTIKKSGAPPFLVDSGVSPPIPLSQMPPSCGFSVKRSRRDVQYAAPYRGCHVGKQNGDYVLPLSLMGEPMSMSCPASLPLPYIFCFPLKMIVKMGGVSASEFKVKVSGTWKPLSSEQECGLTYEELHGELTIIAPYKKGTCIEVKEKEFTLSLQWGDFELLATCPPVEQMDQTSATNSLSKGSDPVLQHPQFPYLPLYSQYIGRDPMQSSPRTVSMTQPQIPVPSADSSESQETSPQHPPVPNIPHLPPFFMFPRPDLPMQPSKNENAAAPQIPFPPMLQSQFKFPIFPQFPMLPEKLPTNAAPTTTTKPQVTTPAPLTEDKGKHQDPLQPQFPLLPLYFPYKPFPPKTQTGAAGDLNGKLQAVHPQAFPYSMLYPLNHPTLSQASQSETSDSTGAKKTPAQQALYHPNPFMPFYLMPKQSPLPMFVPSETPVPAHQHEHPLFYPAMPPFYTFLPDQGQKPPGRRW